MAEQSAFLKAYDEMQKNKGGFNTPTPVAPSFQPQAPQELSTPEFGPTLANEAQLDVSAPAVQTPAVQVETPFFQPTESGQRLASGISSAKDAVFSAANSVSEAGGNLANSTSGVVADLINQSTGGRVNLQSPSASGVATKDNAGAPITDASQLRAFMSGLNEEAAASEPAATLAPEVPAPAVAAPEVMATPESIADLSVNGTNVVTPEAITEAAPSAPRAQLPSTIQNTGGQGLTGFKPKYEGQSLTDFMAGRDDPSAASVQVQDPQGRFRRQAAPVAGETPEQNQARTDALFPEQADFRGESAALQARQAARPDFGEAQTRAAGTVTDRERRAARGDGISDADRRDIAKANQRGASASDIARGDKVAAANGIDRKTGRPLEGDGLTFDQQLKLRSQKFNEGKFEYEITKDAKELYDTNLTKAKEAKTAEAKAESVGKGLASSVADMRDVMGRASGRLDGFFSTDMVGKAASFWKGSDADAQEADFAFLKSNVALNAMMELKANSPTGSTGFGALNTEELKVLTNQFATLDPFTDSKLVRQNLKQLNERFEGIIQNAYNTHAAEYGKEAADGVYGSMVGGKQAQGQSNQAPSGKSVTTANGRFTATAVID